MPHAIADMNPGKFRDDRTGHVVGMRSRHGSGAAPMEGDLLHRLAGVPLRRHAGSPYESTTRRNDAALKLAEWPRQARHDPDFTAAHARLAQIGKPKKVIRVALARKLLVRLNAKVRDIKNAKPA